MHILPHHISAVSGGASSHEGLWKATDVAGFGELVPGARSQAGADFFSLWSEAFGPAQVQTSHASGREASEFQERIGQLQGCGIKGFLPTSVIQGNLPLYEENSLWEALAVVSQKCHSPVATLRVTCLSTCRGRPLLQFGAVAPLGAGLRGPVGISPVGFGCQLQESDAASCASFVREGWH